MPILLGFSLRTNLFRALAQMGLKIPFSQESAGSIPAPAKSAIGANDGGRFWHLPERRARRRSSPCYPLLALVASQIDTQYVPCAFFSFRQCRTIETREADGPGDNRIRLLRCSGPSAPCAFARTPSVREGAPEGFSPSRRTRARPPSCGSGRGRRTRRAA